MQSDGVGSSPSDDGKKTKQFSMALDRLDKGRQRIVVVTRDRDDSSLPALIQLLKSRGFEYDLHYLEVDQPIVFGMSDAKFSE